VDCSICHQTFAQRSSLRSHIHTQADHFEREIGGHTFGEARHLEFHKRADTQPSERSCHICGRTFRHQSSLKAHLRSHIPNRPKIKCPHDGCDKVYVDKPTLNRHLKEVSVRIFPRNTGDGPLT
jgi:KRAB domain-containing zinc finger protein